MGALHGILLGMALLAGLAVAPAASAWSEGDAPSLDPRVLSAGHAPAIVTPHTQWTGVLRLKPGSDVASAAYQVCRVGVACFAPPAPARRVDATTFRFDTANYTVAGPDGARPVDYLAGWRLGVKWFLTDAAGNTTELPRDAGCGTTSDVGCLERNYIAFDMPAATRGTPAPTTLSALLVLVGVVLASARRRHG